MKVAIFRTRIKKALVVIGVVLILNELGWSGFSNQLSLSSVASPVTFVVADGGGATSPPPGSH